MQAAAAVRAKNESYRMLSDDEDEEMTPAPVTSQPERKRKHLRSTTGDAEDDMDSDEAKRIKDIEERDAFAKRLRDRDKKKTKKIVGEGVEAKAKGINAQRVEEIAQKRHIANEDREGYVAVGYLSLRKQQMKSKISK